jgi:hypothetical protein
MSPRSLFLPPMVAAGMSFSRVVPVRDLRRCPGQRHRPCCGNHTRRLRVPYECRAQPTPHATPHATPHDPSTGTVFLPQNVTRRAPRGPTAPILRIEYDSVVEHGSVGQPTASSGSQGPSSSIVTGRSSRSTSGRSTARRSTRTFPRCSRCNPQALMPFPEEIHGVFTRLAERLHRVDKDGERRATPHERMERLGRHCVP